MILSWYTRVISLFDTHCHLDVAGFGHDCQETLTRARNASVDGMVLPGVVRDGWLNLCRLARVESDLFAAPGLHPLYLDHHRTEHFAELEALVAAEPVVAIGEIGLDYHVTDVDRRKQQELFENQLALAARFKLPILLHVRKAHDQILATLRRKRFSWGGIVHAYSGSYQQAEQYINMGFLISFCGTVTYDRAKKIRSLASQLSRDQFVLETDAPDIPPMRHHGERNLPEYLGEICQTIAEIRQESLAEVAAYTTANARRILNIS